MVLTAVLAERSGGQIPTIIRLIWSEVRDGSGGPSRENARLHDVVLSQPTGSSSIGGRCKGTQALAWGSLVCVPAASTDSPSSTDQTGLSFSRVVPRAWPVPSSWDSSPLVVLGRFWFACNSYQHCSDFHFLPPHSKTWRFLYVV